MSPTVVILGHFLGDFLGDFFVNIYWIATQDTWKHRWDASSPFFVEFDKKPRKKKAAASGAGDAEDEEEKSPVLEAKINDLLIENWEG